MIPGYVNLGHRRPGLTADKHKILLFLLDPSATDVVANRRLSVLLKNGLLVSKM